MIRGARIVIVCAAVFTVVLTVARANRAWQNDAYLDHASGAMATLAMDFKEGIFYRPVYGPLGYGGTRYHPLHFVLYAGLWKLMGDFRASGYLLAALEIALLLGGLYALLRRLGVDRALAFGCTGLALASESAQICLHGFHADALAAAMNVWGLALVAGAAASNLAIVGAAALFTLAFAAKVTSVAGIGTALLMLWFSGRARQAWKLVGAIAVGYLMAMAIFYFASQGRWWETLRASATAGAPPGRYLLLLVSPFYVFWNAAYRDPSVLGILLLACTVLVVWPRDARMEIAPLFFLLASLISGAVLTSPGTGVNQELDPAVSALVIVAAWLAREKGRNATFALAGLAVASLLAVPPLWFRFAERDRVPTRQRGEQAVRLIGNTSKPILAENPIVAIRAGRRPYLLDEFMFRNLRGGNPFLGEPLWKGLREQAFSAVVLLDDPRMPSGLSLYNRRSRFDEELYRKVEESYELVAREEDHYVFLPRRR